MQREGCVCSHCAPSEHCTGVGLIECVRWLQLFVTVPKMPAYISVPHPSVVSHSKKSHSDTSCAACDSQLDDGPSSAEFSKKSSPQNKLGPCDAQNELQLQSLYVHSMPPSYTLTMNLELPPTPSPSFFLSEGGWRQEEPGQEERVWSGDQGLELALLLFICVMRQEPASPGPQLLPE